MSASKCVKKLGLKSLGEMSEISDTPRSTLNDWYNNKRALFLAVAHGCVKIKEIEKSP